MPEEYKDPKLDFGYWFTQHRVTIKAVVLSVFFLFFGILIAYNAKQIVDFYIYDEIGRLHGEIINTHILSGDQLERYKPRSVQFQNASIISRGDGNYDIVVEVQNPNHRHKVLSLSTTFIVGSWSSEEIIDTLLPAEQKTVMLLNVSDDGLVKAIGEGAQARVDSGDISWSRIRDIQWFDERNQFVGIGLKAKNITTKQIGATTRELQFDLVNESIFNYRDVEIRALLYNRGKIIAAQRISTSEIRSDTSNKQALRWFYALPQVTNWKIELSTDIFDTDNILPFTLEQFE